MNNFAANEQKWGIWRPYLIEDDQLETLCDAYRTLIRDLRISVMSSQAPSTNHTQLQKVEADMRLKSREIVSVLNKKGW